ncbi:MAG: ISKra4 family transposase [Gammaproteobacteria bacterium]|nr:ISKra4 family transposase [Gammaproteobacteria bacterium]NIW10879.1 ISKra4 family transposase [Gammaproteobacteria bacterium]
MDFNTKLDKAGVEQIATLLSDLVVAHVQEAEGVGIGEIEQGMRQMLQEVGRQAMGQVLEKSDTVEPSIRCQCQHKADYRGRREGMVITVFGRVGYKRSYYVCDHCRRGEKPLDTELKIKPGEISQGLKPLLALLGIQTSFDEAAQLAQAFLLLKISDNSIRKAVRWVGKKQEALEDKWEKLSDWHHYMNDPARQKERVPRRLYGSIDGVMVPTQTEWRELKTICWYEVSPISARQWPSRYKRRVGECEGLKARNIRYHCDIQGAEAFSKRLWATGCHYLADRAQELIFVCDGAQWIWRLIDENFPEAIQILDWYHAVEYLTPVAHALFHDEDKQTAWMTTMKEHLWFSRTQTVIDVCSALANHANASDPAAKAATYFQNNLARMDYAHFRQQGYTIGSGTVESGCKQIGTMRLKRSGAQWLEDGARWVAKARAVWLSGQWQDVVNDYASLPFAI